MCPRTIPAAAIAGALEQAMNTKRNIEFTISPIRCSILTSRSTSAICNCRSDFAAALYINKNNQGSSACWCGGLVTPAMLSVNTIAGDAPPSAEQGCTKKKLFVSPVKPCPAQVGAFVVPSFKLGRSIGSRTMPAERGGRSALD
jgi:hypothetical protein